MSTDARRKSPIGAVPGRGVRLMIHKTERRPVSASERTLAPNLRLQSGFSDRRSSRDSPRFLHRATPPWLAV